MILSGGENALPLELGSGGGAEGVPGTDQNNLTTRDRSGDKIIVINFYYPRLLGAPG